MNAPLQRNLVVAGGLLGVLVLVGGGLWWTFFGTGSPMAAQPTPVPGGPEHSLDGMVPATAAPTRNPALAEGGEPKPGPAAVLQPVTLAEARSHELNERIVLYGLVRDPTGALVADAEIWYDGEILARSDTEGQYRFEAEHRAITRTGNRPRFPTMAARKQGVGVHCVEAPFRSGRLDFVLQHGLSVSGVAFDKATGAPIADTRVHYSCFAEFAGLPRRTTYEAVTACDSRGRFEVADVPVGRVALKASAPGYGMTQWRQIELDDQSARDVELEMSKTQVVVGQFQPWPPKGEDPEGLNLHTRLPETVLKISGIDEEGRFRLELKGRFARIGLALNGPDRVFWQEEIDVPVREDWYDAGVFVIPSAFTIVGSIADFDDYAALKPKLRVMSLSTSINLSHDHDIKADGSFAAATSLDGGISLGLVTGGELITPLGMFQPPGGSVLDAGTLAVKEPLVLGVVTSHRGEPLSGVNVAMEKQRHRDDRWVMVTSFLTDSQGRFVLRPGIALWQSGETNVRLAVQYRQRRAPMRVDLTGFPERQLFRQIQFPEPVALSGQLRDADGSALSNWVVTYESLDGQVTLTDVTAKDGSFQVLDVKGDRYNITLESPGNEVYDLPNHPVEDTGLVCPR